VWASDYFVSSYTPSVSSLLNAYRDAPSEGIRAEGSVVLIAEPAPPGHTELPNTLAEIAQLQSLVPSATTLRDASAAEVLTALPSAAVLHMACHGRQHSDPTRSGFILHDGALELATLMEVHAPRATFAFLSACESAAGDRNLPDEVVHLASAMMFIGFRSVVGTLW
jgi:CHAT domain-containing protein